MRNNIIIFLFFVVICLVNMSSRTPEEKKKADAATAPLKMAEMPATTPAAKPAGNKAVGDIIPKDH